MTLRAHGDFETASAADLRKVGAYRYVEHASTRAHMLGWRLGDDPIVQWRPGWPDPDPLLAHVAAGGVFVAHNANFERQVWNVVVRQRYCPRWPRLEIAQMDDTMARALAMHMPAELGQLGVVLGVSAGKSETGRDVMLKMAKPRKVVPAADAWSEPTYTWWDSPEMLDELWETRCRRDVEDESAIDDKLPPLSPRDRESWEHYQEINDRGVGLDLDTIERAIAVLGVAQRRADVRMAELTGGAVRKCTEAKKLVGWLQSRGIECDSVAKGEHEDLRVRAGELWDDEAEAAIALRGESAKNSTAKFKRFLDCVCADGRLRGMLNWHRTSTGRGGGTGPQLYNLAKFEDPVRNYLPDVLEAIELMEMLS